MSISMISKETTGKLMVSFREGSFSYVFSMDSLDFRVGWIGSMNIFCTSVHHRWFLDALQNNM